MLGKEILSYVDSDLLMFQNEKRKFFCGFPPSGLSGIALCFTLFEN